MKQKKLSGNQKNIMINIVEIIQQGVIKAIKSLYNQDIIADQITMNSTRKEFVGDFTVVVFPFTRIARKKPEVIGDELGEYLVSEIQQISKYNVIKGFLNLVIDNAYWLQFLEEIYEDNSFGYAKPNGQKVMVEFSSPNTNKPLHMGHIRNILLGWSTSKILEAAGYEVVKVQIVNDRGIAICKSMLAWEKFGNGATPESTGTKSDHFVGNFYVKFEQKFQEEYQLWQKSEKGKAIYEAKKKPEQSEIAFFKAFKNTYFNEFSILGKEAKEMLLKWEAGDLETRSLWNKMNQWVYQGFEETYQKLGVSFDKLYYESNTYLLGKDLIDQGLNDGLFYRKADNSVWIDLEDAKLDHKLVLRSDGTSVYMTQDLGTAELRYKDYGVNKMVYVVADEQNYHFQVLFEILKRIGVPYAEGLYHLSYGMVDLPSGRMKSREGTVVDADDLIAEVIAEARIKAKENGETEELEPDAQEEIIRRVALAALKYFIIKVNPKQRMVFNPEESVKLTGQTGPYIQYSYVRINGVSNRATQENVDMEASKAYQTLEPLERELIQLIYQFPANIHQAAEEYDPSVIANYCYNLAKTYSQFWHDLPIFNAETAVRAFRLKLCKAVGHVLKIGLDVLGIEVPERM